MHTINTLLNKLSARDEAGTDQDSFVKALQRLEQRQPHDVAALCVFRSLPKHSEA